MLVPLTVTSASGLYLPIVFAIATGIPVIIFARIIAYTISGIGGAFMYFTTLTEVPIVQGLLAAGMGKGTALALLLAGPSLSLPGMLVIRKVMGNQKTVVYVTLVVVFSTIAGLIFGTLYISGM